jgi:hypothetical protein
MVFFDVRRREGRWAMEWREFVSSRFNRNRNIVSQGATYKNIQGKQHTRVELLLHSIEASIGLGVNIS